MYVGVQQKRVNIKNVHNESLKLSAKCCDLSYCEWTP